MKVGDLFSHPTCVYTGETGEYGRILETYSPTTHYPRVTVHVSYMQRNENEPIGSPAGNPRVTIHEQTGEV
jgi:hypothetical protein